MYVRDVIVKNKVGLHARPATFFIQRANEFQSSIWVERDERRVNAKSLLGVLSLGILGQHQIRIIADGTDEKEAVDALVNLVESGFTAWASCDFDLLKQRRTSFAVFPFSGKIPFDAKDSKIFHKQ